MKIFCVIPAYNEEETIAEVIKEVKPLVNQLVVVDDGSGDRTKHLAKTQKVILLSHLINRGQGAALKTGTIYAVNHQADIIIHFDADGQFAAEDIKKVVAPIINGEAEVVFGSRFLISQKEMTMPGLKKYLIMPLARLANRIILKVNLTDPQSGFRAMTAKVARQISWHQDRMAHCSEILFEVKRYNFKVKEVPIKVIYRHFGQRFFDGLRILTDLIFARLLN